MRFAFLNHLFMQNNQCRIIATEHPWLEEESMSVRDLRAGELVRVKTPREILATLDGEGAFEGVPFMPEMLESCGGIFRVLRCVEKTCVDGHARRR